MSVSIPPRPMRRRVPQLVSVVAAAAVGLGLAATPAQAEVNQECVTRWAMYRAAMSEARFFLRAADRLDAAGNYEAADLATAEANFFIEQASNTLGTLGLC
jgi:hypothetical protein